MKKKIAIASVLKPVNDVRTYLKIAQSLVKTNKYEVNIIGNAAKINFPIENIYVYPHKIRRNQWLRRYTLRLIILFKILKIKPSILIIATHELTVVAGLAKLVLGTKIIYDVQENYRLNATLKKGASPFIFGSLAGINEAIGSLYIDHYWLAEKCYQDELKMPEKKCTVIENKAINIQVNNLPAPHLNVLFSGTVSTYSGIEFAVELMADILRSKPNSKCHIIGQIHDPGLKAWLEGKAYDNPSINLNISFEAIPYPEIIKAIEWASLGIISYQVNDVNKNRIPTKLYEYSRYKLPYVIQKGTKWCELGIKLGGAIPIDFEEPSTEFVIHTILQHKVYFPKRYSKEATWEYESEKLIKSINSL